MYCQKCGTLNTEDARFCVNCGNKLNEDINDSNTSNIVDNTQQQDVLNDHDNQTKILNILDEQTRIFDGVSEKSDTESEKEQVSFSQTPVMEYQRITPAPAPQTKKPVDKKLLAIIIASVVLAVILIASVVFFLISSSKVNVKNYITDDITNTVSITGYDGYGKITYFDFDIIDYYEIYDDLDGEPFGDYDDDDYDDIDDFDDLDDFFDFSLYDYTMAENFENAFNVQASQETNLKNGDVVTFTITVDYDYINNYFDFDKTLTGESSYTIEFAVDGLSPLEEVDPFVMVKNVYYDKKSDKISLEFEQDKKQFGDIYLVADNYNQVLIYDCYDNKLANIYYYAGNNDDKVILSIEINTYYGYDLTDYGIEADVLELTTKEYEPNIISIVNKGDSLSEDDFNDFKEIADDKIENYIDSNNYSSDMKYKSSYFAYDDNNDSNILIFVYSYTYMSTDWFTNETTEETRYGYVYFSNIKSNTDNDVVDMDEVYNNYVTGYDSIDDITDSIKDDGFSKLYSISIKNK